MPGRKYSSEAYRYDYQGQYAEKDGETGLHSFELRQWDARIGRWNSTDPYGQYFSPYMGMGNNPFSLVDPNGGWVPGAGFFKNLFYSDNRINAMNAAGPNGSYFRDPSGGWTANFSDSEGFNIMNFDQATAGSLTMDWAFGTGLENRTFNNDKTADAFRDARVVNQARDYWYKEVNAGRKGVNDGVTNFLGQKAWTGGNFGFKGFFSAGLDPMEQFVGSFTPEISSDSKNLTFKIRNTTSFKSLMYGIGPDWSRSTLRLGGNMGQTYIFTEPINFNRIK